MCIWRGMKKLDMGIIAAALMLAFAFGYFFEGMRANEWDIGRFTGAVAADVEDNATNVSREYAWTTALCGIDRRCIDVTVECNGSQILNVTPVSAVVWHSEDWEDPRGGNPESLCR